MTLPIQTLPVAEQWDCTGCGKCCRGNVVPLDDADLQRLRDQHWDQQPDFRGAKTIVRTSLFGGRYRLAQRPDGTCVFLNEDGLCRIHQEYGFDAKPLVCRMYPLQLVPVNKRANLTLRRSCPTAAADQGRPVDEYRKTVRKFIRERPRLAEPVDPPQIVPGLRRSWSDVELVAGGFEQILTDKRFPLVRRLVHGLRFCDQLEACRLRKLDSSRLGELIEVLSENVIGESGSVFRERSAPGRAASVLFRQTAADYLRLHSIYLSRPPWRSRWRIAIVALAFVRGRGEIPRLHPDFPQARFDALEAIEYGHWEESSQQPLRRYFETVIPSRQYAVASRSGWSLLAKFRATALAYPIALWMLRYMHGDQPPTVPQVIDVVTAIDRGQGYGPLTGSQHRRRVSQLAGLDELARLVAWYAR